MKRLLIIAFSACAFLCHVPASASSCCGGGVGLPAIVIGDEKAVVESSVAAGQTMDDVDAEGVWYPRTAQDTNQTYKISGARLLSDRWQVGAAVPYISRELGPNFSSGLGDIDFMAAFEALPDWDYNVWRPKGLVFWHLSTPTGVSAFDSQDSNRLDVRGRGYWVPGVGLTLTKKFERWDGLLSFELHHGVAQGFSSSTQYGTVYPGYGSVVLLSGGYSLSRYRFGSSLTNVSEQAVRVVGSINSSGSAQTFTSAAISFSVDTDEYWSGSTLSLLAQDQTILGDPTNATLGRSLQITISRTWAR